MIRDDIKTIYTGGLHMAIRDEILEEILKEHKNPEDLMGKDGILKALTKRLVEKAMEGELTHHLGYDKYSFADKNGQPQHSCNQGPFVN
jgi:transposase-like protein